MIWTALLLIGVPFLLMALLAPKTEVENAKASDLDPDNFPKADENSAIPFVAGRVILEGPNTLTYTGFRSVPIRKKVKTGLFSSKNITVGYNYFLTIALGLCLGPAIRLMNINIDREDVFDGEAENIYSDNVDLVLDDFAISPDGALAYTEYDMEDDLNLTDAQMDGSNIELFMEYIYSVTTAAATAELEVKFYDDDDNEVAPIIPGSNDTTSSTSANTTDTINLTLQIPPGTRYMRVGALIQRIFLIGTSLTLESRDITVQGSTSAVDTFSAEIFEPELYGGREAGGGHIGNFTWYSGAFDQEPDPTLEEAYGEGNVPAIPGVCYVVLEDNNIGERAALQKMEFTVETDLGNPLGLDNNGMNTGELDLGDGLTYDRTGDINLMTVLYHIMSNGWSGLNVDPARLNTSLFVTAAETLAAEGNFGAVKVTAGRTAKEVVRELLRQMDCLIAQDETGVAYPVLIRDNYDPDMLPIYDEDDIEDVLKYTKSTWKDVKNEVKASYATRVKESDRVALYQNSAAIAMNRGEKNPTSPSFPFCYDPELANNLAARVGAQLGVPLVQTTLKMKRVAARLLPGDVIKITYPEKNMSELIMRVQDVDRGMFTDEYVEVELIQDTFASRQAVMAVPGDTRWTHDRPEPEEITSFAIVDMPRFFGKKLEETVEDGFGNVIPFPVQPKPTSSGFDFLHGVTSGEIEIYDPQGVSYPISGQLTAAYSDIAGFETGLDATGFTIGTMIGGDDATPVAAALADIVAGEAGILYAGGEWMAYEDITENLDGTFTIENVYRGLLGSRPRTHLVNDRVYFLTLEMINDGVVAQELLEDGTLYYKLLDRVGATTRSPLSEDQQSYVLQDVADRPLRPRNLQLDATRALPFEGDAIHTLTLVASNREETEVTFETDAAEVPDQAEQYNFELWVDGVQDVSFDDDGITLPYDFDVSGVSGAELEVRVWSQRTAGDTKTSVDYAFFPITLAQATALSGDMTDGDDALLLSGDEQSGTDRLLYSGDEG